MPFVRDEAYPRSLRDLLSSLKAPSRLPTIVEEDDEEQVSVAQMPTKLSALGIRTSPPAPVVHRTNSEVKSRIDWLKSLLPLHTIPRRRRNWASAKSKLCRMENASGSE